MTKFLTYVKRRRKLMTTSYQEPHTKCTEGGPRKHESPEFRRAEISQRTLKQNPDQYQSPLPNQSRRIIKNDIIHLGVIFADVAGETTKKRSAESTWASKAGGRVWPRRSDLASKVGCGAKAFSCAARSPQGLALPRFARMRLVCCCSFSDSRQACCLTHGLLNASLPDEKLPPSSG